MDKNETDKDHTDENRTDKIVELNTEETEQVVGGAAPAKHPTSPGGSTLRTLV